MVVNPSYSGPERISAWLHYALKNIMIGKLQENCSEAKPIKIRIKIIQHVKDSKLAQAQLCSFVLIS